MDRAAFCCGENLLDNFFTKHAGEQHENYWARVTVALYEDEIISFYWLSTQGYELEKLSESERQKFTDKVNFAPCVYVGMIGTKLGYDGQGVGRMMMLSAMVDTWEIAQKAGVYALTLEAISEQKAQMYERWKFTRFIPGQLEMYMPISTLRKALQEGGYIKVDI